MFNCAFLGEFKSLNLWKRNNMHLNVLKIAIFNINTKQCDFVSPHKLNYAAMLNCRALKCKRCLYHGYFVTAIHHLFFLLQILLSPFHFHMYDVFTTCLKEGGEQKIPQKMESHLFFFFGFHFISDLLFFGPLLMALIESVTVPFCVQTCLTFITM